MISFRTGSDAAGGLRYLVVQYLKIKSRCEFCEIVRSFLRVKPANTRRAYYAALKSFAGYLNVQQCSKEAASALLSVDSAKALDYAGALKSRKTATGERLSDATINNRLSALSSIYRQLQKHGKISRNPFAVVREVAGGKTRQRRPAKEIKLPEVRALLEAPPDNTPEGIRDRALFAALFGGALRRSEARELTLEDIQETPDGTLYLQLKSTKNGSSAAQPIDITLAPRIRRLVEKRREEGAEPADPLFVGYRASGKPGRQLSESTFYRIWKTYCKPLGIRAGCHSARATAATKALRDGRTPEQVREMLRLNSCSMVDVYDKRSRSIDSNCARVLNFDVEPENKD